MKVTDPRNLPRSWQDAMLAGDFEAAWEETDRIELPRRQVERANFVPNAQHLLWNGDSFCGRDVLVRCNHGLGDTLQFARFLPRVCKLGKSVVVMAQPSLVELLADVPEFGSVVNGWTAPPPLHNLEVEIMELAYAFRVTVETLPRDVPYLWARSGCVPAPLREAHGLRAGLAWAASEWDLSRSIPLEALAPLREAKGVSFYSLQQGAAADAWTNAPFPLESVSSMTRRIPDAVAAICQMNLVITVDSMVAHLAGALGRPVWLLLKHDADWRWMRARLDSPWYPTMRIFRQSRPGDWLGVTQKVAAELQRLDALQSGETVRGS